MAKEKKKLAQVNNVLVTSVETPEAQLFLSNKTRMVGSKW